MVKPKTKTDSAHVLSDALGGGRSIALYGDALTAETRKLRRSLLALSVAGVLISKTGALPSEIPSLGISLSDASREVILYGLIAIIVYYTLTFIIHAWADAVHWKLKYESERVNEFTDWLNTDEGKKGFLADLVAHGVPGAETGDVLQSDHKESFTRIRRHWNASTERFVLNSKLVISRAVLELVFPIVLALAAEILLFGFAMSL